MVEKFNKLSKLARILLLLIPFVNWITELVLRWTNYLDKKQTVHLVIAILVTIPTGVAIGIIDAICVILVDKPFLINATDSGVKDKIDKLDK